MANCHDLFTDFNNLIKLPDSKKQSLSTSKEAIRKKIKKWFEENKKNYSVVFQSQGSYVMETTIIPDSGEYDIDYGVYIIGKEEDKPTATTAHNWIMAAIAGHTNSITDKNTCVRLVYADEKKHVDLPIYYKHKSSKTDYSEIPELAHKRDSWTESDPYAFVKWFKERNSAQLKRIVRYLKAWSDNKSTGKKMPSGLVMTILATNNFVSDVRDDEAFLKTLKAIRNKIDKDFGGSYVCKRPTPKKDENLLDKYDEDTFLKNLSSLIESGDQALALTNQKDACKKWQKHLGERFPCSNATDNSSTGSAKSFSSSDQIYTNAKSA